MNLTRTERWSPPIARTVVVVPHPDDEVLAAGGLILHQLRCGVPVVVVAVTDGDAAYADWDADELRAVRLAEHRAALAELGVDERDVVRLAIPDGRVSEHESALTERLAALVRPDDLLVAPWERDVHPDHEACGRAARCVASQIGCELVATLVWAPRSVDVDDQDVELLGLAIDDADARRRWAAMQCHRSQFDPPGRTPVVDDDLLATLRTDVETYVRVRP